MHDGSDPINNIIIYKLNSGDEQERPSPLLLYYEAVFFSVCQSDVNVGGFITPVRPASAGRQSLPSLSTVIN